MQELIDRIVQNVGIDANLAQKSVGMILGFLQKEAPGETVQNLIGNIPGAEALISANAEGGGGVMGMLGGLMGGGGGVMALGGQLMGAGVGMGQIKGIGSELFAYGREKLGEDAMGEIIGQVPGLSQFV